MIRKLRIALVRFLKLLGAAIVASYAMLVALCLAFPESQLRVMFYHWWDWAWDDLNMMALMPVVLFLPAMVTGAVLPAFGVGTRSTLIGYAIAGMVGIGLALAFLIRVMVTFDAERFAEWQETYYFIPICESLLVISGGLWLRRSLKRSSSLLSPPPSP